MGGQPNDDEGRCAEAGSSVAWEITPFKDIDRKFGVSLGSESESESPTAR
jgi:hypothetical protein